MVYHDYSQKPEDTVTTFTDAAQTFQPSSPKGDKH